MAEISGTISGLENLYKQFQEFPTNVEKDILRGALAAGLNVLADEAKRLVPVKTGALQKSIRVVFTHDSPQSGWVRAKVVAGDFDAFYAHIIEFGSGSYYAGDASKSKRAPYEIKPRGAKSLFFAGVMRAKVVHPGVHPVAFMRGAVDNKQNDAVDTIKAYLAERIPKEFAKQ